MQFSRVTAAALGASIVSLTPFASTSAFAQSTQRASVTSGGLEVPQPSGQPAISGNGKFVAFASNSPLFSIPDNNNASDIFLRDILNGKTERISFGEHVAEANGPSSEPSVSRDGRYVAFSSSATNIANNDTNGLQDVFRYDRVTQVAIMVSTSATGVIANGVSSQPSISADGRFVAFASRATNLSPDDTDTFADIYLKDLESGKIYVASKKSTSINPLAQHKDSRNPHVHADGSGVVFESDASDLINNDNNFVTDVFQYDTITLITKAITVDANGSVIPKGGRRPSISETGRYCAFETLETLQPTDVNSTYDVYVRDRASGLYTLASFSDFTGQTLPNTISEAASISTNGRYVAFTSEGKLSLDDTNAFRDVYQRDVVTGSLMMLSDVIGTTSGNAESRAVMLNDTGCRATFSSAASNLVPADTNNATDVFFHESSPPTAAAAADLAVIPYPDAFVAWTIGSPVPAPIPFTVSNLSADCMSNLGYSVSMSPSVPWLSIDKPYGLVSIDDQEEVLHAVLSPGNIAAGNYVTTMHFQNVVNPADFSDVVFHFRVKAGAPDLCVNGPSQVNNVYSIGGSTVPDTITHVVTNCGAPGSVLDWHCYVDPPAPWLILNHDGGSLDAGKSDVVSAVTDPAGLAPGTYTTKMIFRNLATGTNGFVCQVKFTVGTLIPDLQMPDTSPIVVDYVAGQLPSKFQRVLKNVGVAGSQLNYSVSQNPGALWLNVGPTFGILPGGGSVVLDIRVNPKNLGPGVYKSTITASNVADPLDFATIDVTLNIGLPASDLCTDTAGPFVANYAQGGPATQSSIVNVKNCGPALSQLTYVSHAIPVDVPWLVITPSPIALNSGEQQQVSLVYNPAGLAPGSYQTTVEFYNAANALDRVLVPVTLNVTTPASDLCLDNAQLLLGQYTQGGALPPTLTRTVTNCGDATSKLDFAVIAQPPVAWLEIKDATGSLASGASKPVQFIFHPQGLPSGVYETIVRFGNVANAQDFVDVPARLEVNQPAADLNITPASPITIDYAAGGPNPASPIITMQNLGPAASVLNYSVDALPAVQWLAPTPKSGQLPGAQSTTIQLAINPTGLLAGSYVTTVKFSNLGNAADAMNVQVTLNVTVPKPDLALVGAADINLTYTLGDPTPLPFQVVVKNVGHPLSHLPVAVLPTPSVSWLAVTPNAFTLEGQGVNQQTSVLGFYDVTGLTAGLKTTKIRFIDLADPADFAEINVSIDVKTPPATMCIDSIAPIAASWVQGDVAPAGATRNCKNCGPLASQLHWTAAVSPATPWLLVSPKSGTLAGNLSSPIDIAFNPSGLAVGVFNTNVVFTNTDDAANTFTIPVQITVSDAKPDLCLDSAAAIGVTFDKGGPPPADATRTVSNCGHPQSKLGWTAVENPPVDWLTENPTAGQLTGNNSSVATLHFVVDDSTAKGLHTTTVRFVNLNDAADFVDVPVSLNVTEPDSDLTVLGAPLSATYDIGFDVPQGATFTVGNAGPNGSHLNWKVETLPVASWLSIVGGNGALASGATSDVGVQFVVAGLAPGQYHTVLRFANLDDASDFEEFAIDLKVEEPTADLCIQDDVASIPLSFVIGQTPPTASFAIKNCGDPLADLDYTITMTPQVGWLLVAPMAGTLKFDQASAPIALSLVTAGLVDGDYTTTLHVANLNDATDFVDLPVNLHVGNLTFIPGDRILGGFTQFDSSHELEFDALKNEVIKFNVSSPSKGKLQISVIDSLDKVVKSVVVTTSAKTTKKAIKIKATGHYRLRLEPAKSKLAPFDALTNRKIPKTSLKVKKSGKAGSTGTLDAAIEMLPGGTVSAKALKASAQFVSTLVLGVTTPLGTAFDASAFATPLPNGVQITALPTPLLGSWKFSVSGFDSAKAKAKINLKATQPKGSATITLPGAPSAPPAPATAPPAADVSGTLASPVEPSGD